MQPYLNPNYFNYQPYVPQYQFTQPAIPTMNGRFVNDFAEITANDVPMDGRYALFCKNDMSEIHARTWNAQTGKIDNRVYLPLKAVESEKTNNSTQNTVQGETEPFNDVWKGISEQLKANGERMERLEEYIKTNLRPAKTKKEVTENE